MSSTGVNRQHHKKRELHLLKLLASCVVIALSTYAPSVSAQTTLLNCRGWDFTHNNPIAFSIELDTAHPGAISWIAGDRYYTRCDAAECMLNHPPETPDRPTRQFVISRVDGFFRSIINSQGRALYGARRDGDGCFPTKQLF